jgi:hypothetical protein
LRKLSFILLTSFCLFLLCVSIQSHETRPGYLEIREKADGEYMASWKQPVRGELRLKIDPIFPPECGVELTTHESDGGALMVNFSLGCEDGIRGKLIVISGLENTMTDVLIRVFYADGATETHLLRPDSPSAVIGGTEGPLKRAFAYVRLGIEHIIMGIDHLLFVLGLLLIVRNRWMLLKTITSFTLAHSITLAIATLGYASVPVQPLNAAIALSILFIGPEVVRSWRGGTSLTIRHPWVVAFAFGLLHGFGFASGLTMMGLPRNEIPLALLLFNVGVEIGQVCFIFLILGLGKCFRILQINWPRWVELIPGYAVGSLGAFWTIQRVIILFGG